MEAGRKAVALYTKLERVNEGTKELQRAFPRLLIDTVLNQPYTHVTMRVRNKPPSPWDMTAEEHDYGITWLDFEDPIDSYPTDHLVAQLALIA